MIRKPELLYKRRRLFNCNPGTNEKVEPKQPSEKPVNNQTDSTIEIINIDDSFVDDNWGDLDKVIECLDNSIKEAEEQTPNTNIMEVLYNVILTILIGI